MLLGYWELVDKKCFYVKNGTRQNRFSYWWDTYMNSKRFLPIITGYYPPPIIVGNLHRHSPHSISRPLVILILESSSPMSITRPAR